MRARSSWFCAAAVLALVAGCGGDDLEATPASPGAPVREREPQPEPEPPGPLGGEDGITLSIVLEPNKLRDPTDLAFNPSVPTELWVVNRADDSALIIQDPGSSETTWERRRDPEAAHFMNAPMGIAFGAVSPAWGQTFAVCGDSDNGGNHFMGPTLFSAEPDVFAEPTGKLGSHLDMLHSTSFCRGIAHVEDNVYFVFNGELGVIDRYDFHHDHGPGNDDHADGEIHRVRGGDLMGEPAVPSHLVYDPEDASLYIADTGNGRIVRLDTASGSAGASFPGHEDVETRRWIEDAVFEEIVPPGVVEAPSGLELFGGLLYVSDSQSGRFYAFDLEGELLHEVDTELGPGSLAGFAFGPEGRIYFADRLTSRVLRIDPVMP
jgi:DNA-binding beta-propeller fold protein YncE